MIIEVVVVVNVVLTKVRMVVEGTVQGQEWQAGRYIHRWQRCSVTGN